MLIGRMYELEPTAIGLIHGYKGYCLFSTGLLLRNQTFLLACSWISSHTRVSIPPWSPRVAPYIFDLESSLHEETDKSEDISI